MGKSVALGFTTLNGGSQIELGQNGTFGAPTDLVASGIDLRVAIRSMSMSNTDGTAAHGDGDRFNDPRRGDADERDANL